MEIPQIPTDNLYKFKAIVGVVITLASLWLPSSKIYNIGTQIIELTTQIKKLEIAANELSCEYNRLKKKKAPTDTELTSARQKRIQLQYQAEDIKGNYNKIKFYGSIISVVSILSIAGIIVGSLMARIGFKEWHTNVQKPQDSLLNLQVKSLEAEVVERSSEKSS